jgi:hypothetical protein
LDEVLEWLQGEFTYEQTRDARVGAFLRKKQKPGESARSHAHALLLLHQKAGLEYNKKQLCATFVNSLQDDLKRLLKSELALRQGAERDDWEGIRELADHLEKKYFHLVNPARAKPARAAAMDMMAGDGAEELEPQVAAMAGRPVPARAAGPPRQQYRSAPPRVVCFGCGQPGHVRRDCPVPGDRRPARAGLRCFSCGQIGHFARDCGEIRSTATARPVGRFQGRNQRPAGGGARKGVAPQQMAKVVAALSALMEGQQTPLNA